MMNPWTLSALWVGSALIATVLAIRFRVSSACSLVGATAGPGICVAPVRRGHARQIAFLTETASHAHSFLAGAELDLVIFPRKWHEALLGEPAGVPGPFLTLRPRSSNLCLSAIPVAYPHGSCQGSDSNWSHEHIFPYPASPRREQDTEIRACDGRDIGGRDGKPCFYWISENSGGL